MLPVRFVLFLACMSFVIATAGTEREAQLTLAVAEAMAARDAWRMQALRATSANRAWGEAAPKWQQSINEATSAAIEAQQIAKDAINVAKMWRRDYEAAVARQCVALRFAEFRRENAIPPSASIP